MDLNSTKIFFRGSKTYFTSSLFFPREIRQDVFTLYAFVRVADDYVDQALQDPSKIKKFKNLYKKAESGETIDNKVIENFVNLSKRNKFKKEWTDAFLESMIQDTKKSEYKTIDETLNYIYGSAEVIGLMMAKIMKLDKRSYKYAKLLGRSMQYANFLRDIDEDHKLGRQYIPTSEIKTYNLRNLSKKEVYSNKESFLKLMESEIKRFEEWQENAEKGFHFIPKRYLIAVKTASDMYKWTISELKRNPLLVYERKVKPSRIRILLTAFANILKPNFKYKLAIYVLLFAYITS